MDGRSQVRHAAALAVRTTTWLRDEEAECSTKVQQPHCPRLTVSSPPRPADLRQRPPATALPPDGKEKVYGSIP